MRKKVLFILVALGLHGTGLGLSLALPHSVTSLLFLSLFLLPASVIFSLSPSSQGLLSLGEFLLYLSGRWLFHRELPFPWSFPLSLLICGMAAWLCLFCHWRRKEEREILEELRILTVTDGLTGIHNRRFLSQILEQGQIFQQKNIALLFLDIDFFKQYNDTFGHICGDQCLKRLARILEDFLKEREGFCVRYGGEEFLLCLFDFTREQALEAANYLRHLTEQSCGQAEIPSCSPVTVSVGIALAPSWSAETARELIHQADRALYRAKHQGRNCVEFFDSSEASIFS